jgi:phosphomannomutase
VITASHNPKQDNGYKLYAANGCQIIPPVDSLISDCILKSLDVIVWDTNMVDHHPNTIDIYNDMTNRYFNRISELTLFKYPLTCVYTPLHGVGGLFASRAFESVGLPPFIPTSIQMSPNPEFPTVSYPNPEEGKCSLDCAIQTAESHHCRLILANDPDADRLAVSEKQYSQFIPNSL